MLLRIALLVKLAIKATYDNDMYNRAFPVGNALFLFAGGMMSLLCLPCSKFSLAFLAVPAGKDGRVCNKLGSFPCTHSATLTGRTYTPSAA